MKYTRVGVLRSMAAFGMLAAMTPLAGCGGSQGGTDTISGTGTVRAVTVNTTSYVIKADSGETYAPYNMTPDFQQDGLRVRFKATPPTRPVGSSEQVGLLVELTSIEKL